MISLDALTMEPGSRFEQDASRYAAYLQTPEGRLRTDSAVANVQECLPDPPTLHSLRALDIGCGTGAVGIRLARLGIQVTLLDSSPAMLRIAERGIVEARLGDRVALKHGDAERLSDIFSAGSFDVIVCHNVLEYMHNPSSVLRGTVELMPDCSAILSVLVRNQAGEVLKAALKNGDFAAAEHHVSASYGRESLYAGEVRLFTVESLESMLTDASLGIVSERGVRVIADYLPAQISKTAEYERILALERELGKRREFFAVARYLQCVARCVSASSGGDQ